MLTVRFKLVLPFFSLFGIGTFILLQNINFTFNAQLCLFKHLSIIFSLFSWVLCSKIVEKIVYQPFIGKRLFDALVC